MIMQVPTVAHPRTHRPPSLLCVRALVLSMVGLGWHVIDQAYFASEVVYDGVYEPLPGVEMSRAYETSLDLSFEVRSGLYFERLIYVMPLIGAGLGLAFALVLHRAGLRLLRNAR